jgi:tRNA A37 methylthiotransferase MiaB
LFWLLEFRSFDIVSDFDIRILNFRCQTTTYRRKKWFLAEKYPQKVPVKTIKAWCERMRRLEMTKKAFYKRFTGKTVRVLTKGKRYTATELLKGITSNLKSAILGFENI